MSAITKRVEILPAKRRALILEHLRSNGATAIGELATAIGGSQSTIRRDLEHLVEGGYLHRTHGGAILLPHAGATFQQEPSINAQMHHAEKVAIGRVAATLLDPGESVVFDGSSTVLEAVRAASQRGIQLTTITNSIDMAAMCSDVPGWRVIMPGGTVRAGTRLLVGDLGRSFFEDVHADVCMAGAVAVTGDMLTDASMEVAAMKRAMLGSARRRILLVDSSKFTAPAFCTFGKLSKFDHVITDEGIDPEHLERLKMTVAKVTVAQSS